MPAEGTKETKAFYDSQGWEVVETGASLDQELFGVKEDGPIRQRIFERANDRYLGFVAPDQPSSSVLEVGCGGSPNIRLPYMFDKYTGVDFSSKGLSMARQKLSAFGETVELLEADAVKLPFEDETFDTVYSAHMIYHIRDRKAQAAALDEMLRVVKSKGTIVLMTANPRPLLFPMRYLFRLVADTPLLSDIARNIKGSSPIPYNPAKLGWYKRHFGKRAECRIVSGGIASTAFNQSVTEFKHPGKILWSLFDQLDEKFPYASAYLGNYATFFLTKS